MCAISFFYVWCVEFHSCCYLWCACIIWSFCTVDHLGTLVSFTLDFSRYLGYLHFFQYVAYDISSPVSTFHTALTPVDDMHSQNARSSFCFEPGMVLYSWYLLSKPAVTSKMSTIIVFLFIQALSYASRLTILVSIDDQSFLSHRCSLVGILFSQVFAASLV